MSAPLLFDLPPCSPTPAGLSNLGGLERGRPRILLPFRPVRARTERPDRGSRFHSSRQDLVPRNSPGPREQQIHILQIKPKAMAEFRVEYVGIWLRIRKPGRNEKGSAPSYMQIVSAGAMPVMYLSYKT